MDADERASFDAFVRVRMPELSRFAYALTANSAHADDLVQEALLQVGTRWSRVLASGDPARYVRQVMVNQRISWWRRRRLERLVAVVPEQFYEPVGRSFEVWDALAALPPRQRAVLALRYVADYSEQQAAAALGCSVGTVKSQSAKALRTLRERLGSPLREAEQPK
ncbi:MAG TPA: SigE family RNA polymerase sigma factor [Mycobacteriales bacterium]|nr:SigE family RNA polymerase sigma factor [Mycobacteriales bacterium]